jgi:hypothetical protein
VHRRRRGRDCERVVTMEGQEHRSVPARSRERARHRARNPVFVDGSGRRHTWIARSLVGLTVGAIGYVLVLAVGLLGGSAPGGLVLWPHGSPTGEQDGGRLAEPVASPAAHSTRPAAPTVPAGRAGSGALPTSSAPSTTSRVPATTSSTPATYGPNPTPTTATTVPTTTHGRSGDAPGRVKHSPTSSSRPSADPSPSR